MTIVAGFSATHNGSAPLHLAAQIARTTGEQVIAAAILAGPSVIGIDQLDREYHHQLSIQVLRSLNQAIAQMRTDVDITPVVHRSTSIPRGLTELTAQHNADLIVVGSSSSGLLGRIALGSVTERLAHTARVPVAISPRGYPRSPLTLERLTVGYGGMSGTTPIVGTAAELAVQWDVQMRIASFAVRPPLMLSGSIEPSAEDLVTDQWTSNAVRALRRQLDRARETIPLPDVDLVIGMGIDWSTAVNDIAWESGDLLVLGSAAAGPLAQVFLGSAASKILRHVPVPVMILPQMQG
ncbi:universal stress protein [Mycobacterium dioxanotrophicus]|uniref:Universal stress protein n=1 Tax=Mycobacterium dioxanotrophicus TaxID=482462 RepID=A0A1Y0CCC8_9MYCO|nr:universal stress protein [Mycobacterium dioxanotrophicus]ART72910.1 universal stress protein [Mycobacterium dioxanotrophicus]